MSTTAAASSPAAPKAAYDPIKAVEGMFNGSVTRIGYALKDPADYGPSTKTVLAECAKRFHDALDDCEIQLLDAKWYLEHQLRSNRLRREAQAREMGTAAKRKHDEIKEEAEKDTVEDMVTKKPKLNQESEQPTGKEQLAPKESDAVSKFVQVNGVSSEKQQPESRQKQVSQVEKVPHEITEQLPSQSQSKAEVPETSTSTQHRQQQQPPPAPPDDFAKPTPQATPTNTNDDFNFESMFGDPTGDIRGDSSKDDDDLNFDFTTGDLSNEIREISNQEPDSLDSLLPGLESYANQTDNSIPNADLINIDTTNTNNNNNNNINTDTINNNNNGTNLNDNTNPPNNTQDPNTLPSFANDFDLPDMGAPNIFDDFLNDDHLGGVDLGGNFEDNIDLSDSALLDLDFGDFK